MLYRSKILSGSALYIDVPNTNTPILHLVVGRAGNGKRWEVFAILRFDFKIFEK